MSVICLHIIIIQLICSSKREEDPSLVILLSHASYAFGSIEFPLEVESMFRPVCLYYLSRTLGDIEMVCS